MIPFGANSRTNSSLTSFGWISQKTCASRTRRAISCVTCEPKSRIRILSCMSGACAEWWRRRGAARGARAEVEPGQHQRRELDQRAEVERRADAPVAARQVRDRRRAAARRSPARPPPSGFAASSPRPSCGPGCVASAAPEMMLWIDAATVKPRTLQRITAYIIQPSRRRAPAEVGERRRHQADDRQALRREALEQPAEQHALHQRRHAADREQRPAVLLGPQPNLKVV